MSKWHEEENVKVNNAMQEENEETEGEEEDNATEINDDADSNIDHRGPHTVAFS